MEYVVSLILGLIGYLLGTRKRNLSNKKLELEILSIGTDVWGSIKEDLMEQIGMLKDEVNELKEENRQLRLEIVNLQNVINTYNNSN